MRLCSGCNNESDEKYFKKGSNKCRTCRQEYSKKYYLDKDKAVKDKKYIENRDKKLEYQKEYYKENKDEIEKYRKEYYIENREEIIEKQLIRDQKPERAAELSEYRKEYRKNNKIKTKEYGKTKRSKVANRLRNKISNDIYQALKYNNSSKNGISCLKFVNYTIQELKQHIESLFENWMSWENWGIYNNKTWNDEEKSTWIWQLDHIIPQSDLPYTSMEDENFKKCWALSNLRPYSAKLNILDGSYKVRHKKKE